MSKFLHQHAKRIQHNAVCTLHSALLPCCLLGNMQTAFNIMHFALGFFVKTCDAQNSCCRDLPLCFRVFIAVVGLGFQVLA